MSAQPTGDASTYVLLKAWALSVEQNEGFPSSMLPSFLPPQKLQKVN